MFSTVRGKVIVAFLIAIVAVVVVRGAVAIELARWETGRAADSMGFRAAQATSSILTTIGAEESEFRPGSRYADAYRESLRSLCGESEMDNLYVCRYDLEHDTITYLVCVADEDEADATMQAERPYGTVVPIGELSESERLALQGQPTDKPYEMQNDFGHTLEWFYPIPSLGDDVLVGVSYSVDRQNEKILEEAIRFVGPFALSLLVLLVAELIVLRRNVFEPLAKIATRMREFTAADASEFEPLGVETSDELGNIAEAFEGMASDIATYTADIERMASERAHAQAELDVARKIQLGLVSERAHRDSPLVELAGFSRPAQTVGGDFYDLVDLGDGRVAGVIGDVSGKGVAAALFLSMAMAVLRDGFASGKGPAEVLLHANGRLAEWNPEGMFVTVFAGIFDVATGELIYANAGHVPPLVVGNEVRTLIVSPGEFLGVFDDADIVEERTTLMPGETLLLFTDGVTEAVDADGHFLGDEFLARHLAEALPFASADQMVDDVVGMVDSFAQGAEQFDDLTVVAVRCKRPSMDDGNAKGTGPQRSPNASAGQLRVVGPKRGGSLPCSLDAFDEVRSAVLKANVADDLKLQMCLACEEAFANVVSYSGATVVRYAATEVEGGLLVTLVDDGKAFDPTTSTPVEKDFEDLDTGGMGIHLLRDLASSLLYRREGGLNKLSILMVSDEAQDGA